MKAWGLPAAKQLAKRLYQLQAAQNLYEFYLIAPGTRPHALKGRRKGEWGITVQGGLRLIVSPLNPAEDFTLEGGGIDWREITRIKILEVTDYHDERR